MAKATRIGTEEAKLKCKPSSKIFCNTCATSAGSRRRLGRGAMLEIGNRSQSSRGLEHSKTLRVFQSSACRAQRLGLLQPSAAFTGGK